MDAKTSGAEKKPFNPPVLTVYGGIRDITHSVGNSATNDGGQSSGMTMIKT